MLKTFIKKTLSDLGLEISLKKNLWYKDAWEIQKRLLSGIKKPIIFDVGACDGTTVCKYKSLFPDSIVHAFEPQPKPFQNLTKLTQHYKNVYTNNLALSNYCGRSDFTITEGYYSSSLLNPLPNTSIEIHTRPNSKIKVNVTTIDQYSFEKGIKEINLLKMDVQGSELNVLKGAESLLKTGGVQVIYSEIWFNAAYEEQAYYEDIIVYLKKFNFKIHGIYNVSYDFSKNGENLWGDAIFLKQ